MVDQIVVAAGVAVGRIALAHHHDPVGRCDQAVVADPVGGRQALGLTRERNDADQHRIGTTGAELGDGFGRREVEASGHAAQKTAVPAPIEGFEGNGQQIGGFIAIDAPTGEGCGLRSIRNHDVKIRILA